MSNLKDSPLDEAIRLRWVLRDIKARRFVISPVDPADIQALTQMGYVEVHKEIPLDAGMEEI